MYLEEIVQNMNLLRGSTTKYEFTKQKYHKIWIYLVEVPQNMNLVKGSTTKYEFT